MLFKRSDPKTEIEGIDRAVEILLVLKNLIENRLNLVKERLSI